VIHRPASAGRPKRASTKLNQSALLAGSRRIASRTARSAFAGMSLTQAASATWAGDSQ
jgi:hypothetical protein